jgi:hypothetical protein
MYLTSFIIHTNQSIFKVKLSPTFGTYRMVNLPTCDQFLCSGPQSHFPLHALADTGYNIYGWYVYYFFSFYHNPPITFFFFFPLNCNRGVVDRVGMEMEMVQRGMTEYIKLGSRWPERGRLFQGSFFLGCDTLESLESSGSVG